MVRETPNKEHASTSGCSRKAGTSGMNDAAMDIYDSEAAENAFCNAPKVTRRQFAKKSVYKAHGGVTDDEEETEQPYDENNDRELNAKIAGFMQEFISKKINANNAFETKIFEKLNNVVEVESLQCVGTMLDASARVYAFRVDNTHGECFTVRTTIDESKKKKGPVNDEPRNLTTTDENVEAADYPAEDRQSATAEKDGDENGSAAVEEDQRLLKAKQKKARQKESKIAEQNGHVQDLLKKAASLAERFSNISLPDEVIDDETVNAGFDYYINQMEDLSTLRRVKIPFINEKSGNVDRAYEEYGIDDPIYHKVAKEFEEGCAQSFVNNEVLTSLDGCFLILHTNWKNDEPNVPPQPAVFSTKHDHIFDELEGSLERALAYEPCNLTMLQQFCEDDSDEEDNSLHKIRLLGRPSQTVKRITQNQLPEPETRETSIENDAETSSIFSMTEEDQSRKTHEELAKFQMLLDDNDEQPVKKEPFDSENFFSTDFSELVRQEADESELQKATFHAISNDDAVLFGISPELMAEIRMSLKSGLSEELQQRLFDAMGPENRRRIEVVLETKDLTKKESSKGAAEVTQPLDFFVTRFAPLIDSVWHATIKKATEDQLSKVGFQFGFKGLQRTTMRLCASAMKSASKKRRGPYITPTKTPILHSSMYTPERNNISPQSANNSRLTSRRLQFSSARKKAISRLKLPGAASTGKKNKQALHEVSDDDTIDIPNISLVNQISRGSTLIGQSKSYIYFWARPREYPKVYLEQVLDEKDNPMQSTDFLDMDELLGLNEENVAKWSTVDSQKMDGSVTLDSMNETPVPPAENTLENVNNFEPMAVSEYDDDDPFLHSMDFGDDLNLDVSVNMNGQAETAENKTLQQAEKNEATDILNILSHPTESIAEELLDVEEVTTEAPVAARTEPNIEDDSHWKGAPKAVADQLVVQETEATKKVKKNMPSKPKRQKLDVQAQEEEEMNWDLEESTPLEKVKALNSQFKASLLTKLPDESMLDIVGAGSVKLADIYDPIDLINRSLLFKRKSGYWKNTRNGPEYVKLRTGYAMHSVEEEHQQCVSVLTANSPKKKKLNNDQETRTAQKTNLMNLQEVFGDTQDDAGVNFYDIIISPRQIRSVSPVDRRLLGDEKDEQMEFNGGIIKIRQTRVKAPMVKRAITSVLASKETDLNAMQKILEFSSVKNRTDGDLGEDSDSNDADIDAYSDESDEEGEPEDVVRRQSGSLSGSGASAGFKIQGEHHFSNLCAYLPEYLSGRTKLDLNVINTFAITLHMCNEHSLHLVQDVDPQTKLITKGGMTDFKIQLFKQ